MAGIDCTKIHHVAIIVDDLDAARTFYRDILLLAEIERPPFPTVGLWLQVGQAQIHVGIGDERPPRRRHFALEVSDFEEAVAHLESKGVEVHRAPVVPGAGLQAVVHDPAGNLIELRQSA